MISHYLFLLCTLYSFFNLFCAQSPHSLPLAFIIKTQNDCHPLSEGFDGSTLVKTPYGYSPIKDLKVGDSILDHNNESKKIISIRQKLVTQWVVLNSKDENFCVACDQLLYISKQKSFIAAKDFLKLSLFCNDINVIKKINGLKIVYCITVKDHIFCITHQDIPVHNSNAILIHSFCLGYISIINPVIAILGATISLARIGYILYQKDIDSESNLEEIKINLKRTYYVKRKNELLTLKNNFLKIKNELQQLKDLASSNFTYEFLRTNSSIYLTNNPCYLELSLTKELSLSLEEKTKLQHNRDSELLQIEQDIFTLQLTLALHINELIEQRALLQESYITLLSKQQQAFYNGKNKPITNCPISNDNALELYKYNLFEEHILNAIINKSNEIQVILNYYSINDKTALFKKCSSLLELIDQEKNWQKNNQSLIHQAKTIISQNIINIEKHLKNQKYPTKDFALKIKKILDKKQKEINKKAFIKAINKYLTIQNSLNQKTKDETTNDTITDAQAPGKPTEIDGFIPAKNWDGQKVKNPHGGGYGWPDKNKNVWIPSGPKGHGGPHWDIQNPKKQNDHRNVFPGGKER